MASPEFTISQPIDAVLIKRHFKLDMSVGEIQEVINEKDRLGAATRKFID